MFTFGPMIAKNSRSGRLLGGAPVTVTTLDGVTLDTYTVDGQPLTLVTNHEGYHGTFRADTDQRVILARPRGGDPLPLYAHEGIQDAAEAADTINTGRLSEQSLTSTIAAGSGVTVGNADVIDGDTITIDLDAAWGINDDGYAYLAEDGPAPGEEARAFFSDDGRLAWQRLSDIAPTPPLEVPDTPIGQEFGPPQIAYTPVPALPAATITPAPAIGLYPTWMSDDGTEIYNQRSTVLHKAGPDGTDWTAIHTFDGTVSAVRTLPDGELLVGIRHMTAPGEVWRSTGYRLGTATWEHVLTLGVDGAYVQAGWGMDVYDDLVVVTEYGPKAPPACATKTYLSRDQGQTFTLIRDGGQIADRHNHGIAYDPWWDRIWLTQGDGVNEAILYADGPTYTDWTTIKNDVQGVTIVPMERCILILSDSPPNGIWRYERLPGKQLSEFQVPVLLDNMNRLTLLGSMGYRRPGNPAHPVLLPIRSAAYEGRGRLIATHDGYRFHELWADDQTYTDKGLIVTLGPTATGKYISALADDRQSTWSLLSIDAPEWATSWNGVTP